MLIGLIVFFGLSFLIMAHEAGHFLAAKWFGLKVEEFGFGFPPRLWAWRPFDKAQGKKGETEYSINWLPFGGFVRIAGENDRLDDGSPMPHLSESERKRNFMFQPAWKRAVVIVAGVFVNFLAGWWLLTGVYLIGTPQHVLITGIQTGSPAEQVGLKTGDLVLDFQTSKQFIDYIDANRGKQIDVRVRRSDKDLAFQAVPRVETGPNQGALGVLLGETGVRRQGFFGAVRESLLNVVDLFWYTLVSFWQLIIQLITRASIPEGVAGPVGIFSVAQEAGKLGFVYLLQLIALISINLSVLNIIPFPALDGGRLFLILLEKVKGSPISVRVESWINGLGFLFLMAFIFAITLHDVIRLLY